MTDYLVGAFVYLLAAVVAVLVTKRLGLGSVLGYLLAGVFIGPVLGIVGKETESLQHVAEFGVVMMLFLVGLELEPKMLWELRHRLLGLGGLQVLLSAGLFAGAGLLAGLQWQVAVTIGLVLSLSSTAIVLQTFQEKGVAGTPGGRAAFSVLLFQDIAVIPMLALIPLLALPELAQVGGGEHGGDHHDINLVAGLSGWTYAAVVLGAVAAVVVFGHFFSRPLFRAAANTGLREAFTAVALTLVIGVAVLMLLVGLSPALGTFLAGVVLANSEFRHELETDIEPFKGLLLGLFFITVGAGISFPLLFDNVFLILGLTLGVMLAKGLVLVLLALVFKLRRSEGWLFSMSLAQAGEFGFVLLAYSLQNNALPADMAPLLALVVAISMFLTPLLFIAFDRFVVPRYDGDSQQREADTIDSTGPVIVAGIGRFGQIVNRLLTSNGIKTVVLDRQPGQIENMREIDIRSYFGDASRPDLLHTAGIESASLFVLAIDEQEQGVELVRHLKHRYPGLKILARAYDRGHHYRLRDAGADFIVSETFHSALDLGAEALRQLGVHPYRAQNLKKAFIRAEYAGHEELYEMWRKQDEGEKMSRDYLDLFMKLDQAMTDVMQHDRTDPHRLSERGWNPPPKGYAGDLD
jgi:monovalent cation:proton antiporter-2 (CPA2) family protein